MSIVIAYDGSDSAKAAVDDLRRSGMPREANAMVVSVGETLLPTPSPSSAAISGGVMSNRVAGTLVQAREETVPAGEEASALAHEGSQLACCRGREETERSRVSGERGILRPTSL